MRQDNLGAAAGHFVVELTGFNKSRENQNRQDRKRIQSLLKVKRFTMAYRIATAH